MVDQRVLFSAFLAKNEIKHILARVKHPQTNGKIEKWYHTYEKSRKSFDDFNKNFPIGITRLAITRASMRNTIFRLQKMHFGQRIPE